MKPIRLLCLLALAWTATLPPTAEASYFGDTLGISPYKSWKTLATPRFDIHYTAGLEETAKKTAQYLEEAHAVLKESLFWEPHHRVQILLLDNSDAANGSSGPVVRFGITLYTTPPESWFSIGNTDDWLRMLCMHEYTHYLNMDPVQGWMWALWVLFGDAVRPNTLWTTWMLEGLAVYMESAHTQAGGGRSAFYEMILRTAVRDQKLGDPSFMNLDRLQGDNPWFPEGETPYFFGYHLMNEVAHGARKSTQTADGRDPLAFGDQVFGRLSMRSGGRVPFFVNGNLQAVTGRRWRQVWADWAGRSVARMQTELTTLGKRPLTPVEALTPYELELLGPKPSPDGRLLAYTADTDDHSRTGLFIKDLPSGEIRRLTSKRMGATHAFTPDGRWILTSSLRPIHEYDTYSDLLAVDAGSGAEVWLTEGLRAKDPALSPDGRTLVFSVSRQSTVGVAAARLQYTAGEDPRLTDIRDLYFPPALDRASQPTVSADGKWAVFSIHRNGQVGDDLVRVSLEGGKPETIVHDGSRNQYPTFSPDGALVYVSDRSGVENVYRDREGEAPVMLTHVDTGVRFPSFDSKGALYLSHFELAGWAAGRVDHPSNSTDWRSVAVTAEGPNGAHGADPVPPAATITDEGAYSPGPTLWPPRQWAPFIQGSGSGLYFSGELLGFDALDLHEYSLIAAYDTYVGMLEGSAQYSYRGLGPTVSLSIEQTTPFIQSGSHGPSEFDRRTRATVTASIPLRGEWSVFLPALSFSWERTVTHFRSTTPDTLLGSPPLPVATAGFSLSNAESSPLAITTERGYRLTAAGRYYGLAAPGVWKGAATARVYLPISGHTILTPAVAFAVANRNGGYSPALVEVEGGTPALLNFVSPFAGSGSPFSGLEGLSLRGYGQSFRSLQAAVGSADLAFPLARIFSGKDTLPLFAENLLGYVFGESAYFPTSRVALPSVGGGLKLTGTLFVHAPAALTLAVHQGLRPEFGGETQLVVSFQASGVLGL
ncbi:MAG TPA: hypothetical protein VL588_00860 [Bdellovibrionota bacterium]|nr:hypothetical protein [Bdellovibrionota bacterium]